jgi:hypothetical protein
LLWASVWIEKLNTGLIQTTVVRLHGTILPLLNLRCKPYLIMECLSTITNSIQQNLLLSTVSFRRPSSIFWHIVAHTRKWIQ